MEELRQQREMEVQTLRCQLGWRLGLAAEKLISQHRTRVRLPLVDMGRPHGHRVLWGRDVPQISRRASVGLGPSLRMENSGGHHPDRTTRQQSQCLKIERQKHDFPSRRLPGNYMAYP